MCNPQHCQDLHAIKLVGNDRATPDSGNVVNPYNWNIDNEKKFFIPPNHNAYSIGFDFFWKCNDTFNYFHSIWKNGKVHQFMQGQSAAFGTASDEHTHAFILWIDRKAHDHAHIEQQLSHGERIKLDFCETMSKGERHLLTHIDKIRSSPSPFQIICRGYYKDENKNPLDLLQFLDTHRLQHIPVLVFTQDVSGLNGHLQHQAPTKGTHDWKQRLFITDNSEKLVTAIRENIDRRE